MSATTTELSDVLRALAQLRTGVGALRARYGDVAEVRRIDNDLERLEIDVADLSTVNPAPMQRHGGTKQREMVEVPDTPYDSSLWRDVDEEGMGGWKHEH